MRRDWEAAVDNLTPVAAFELGWSIIPCGRNKKPLLATWKPYQQRQATQAEWSAWLRLRPACWALVTGAVSKRITLDFDGARGCEWLKRLGLDPHRKTPSAGYHADFVHPGWHIKTLNSKTNHELAARWPGLDIRADGGYACFFGRTNEGEYRWLRDPQPYQLDILPTSMRTFFGLLKPEESPHTSGATIANPMRTSGNGTNGNGKGAANGHRADPEVLVRMALDRVSENRGRNNSGFWLATQCRDNDFTQAETESLMRTFRSSCPSTNTKGIRETYSEAEIEATVKQVFRKPARDAWNPPTGGRR
jgi:hypothetical protein